MRISNNIYALHNLDFNVNMVYFLTTMHYVLSVLVQMVEMLHSMSSSEMWLNARSYVSHICEGDRLSWKSVRVRGKSDILERDGGRYCRRENEKCWQVVREEFRALTLFHYCLKNKTHCLQTKNHTYNGQTTKIMFIFSQLPFLELFAFIGWKTFFMLQERRSNKASSLFDLWSRRRSRLWCCSSLDWSLEAPACVHVCMSYTALCQVEFIRVQFVCCNKMKPL